MIALVVIGIAPIITHATKASSPLKIEMNLLQTPKLNDVVDVQIKVYLTDFNESYPVNKNYPLQVEFVPSDGFEYVGGDFQYTDKEIGASNPRNGYKWFADSIGSLISEENKVAILNAKIKAIKAGDNWEVVSGVLMPYVCEDCPVKVGGQVSAANVLFISFDQTSGSITRERAENQPITGQNLIFYIGIGILIVIVITVVILMKRRK